MLMATNIRLGRVRHCTVNLGHIELCLNSNFNHELSNEKHLVITNLTLTYIFFYEW